MRFSLDCKAEGCDELLPQESVSCAGLVPKTLSFAINAPMAGKALPMIVVSHATGDSCPGRFDTATYSITTCSETHLGAHAASIVGFEDDDEAVALANATEYGLAGYFYSRDVGRIWKIAEHLECGMVGVNTGILTTEVAPFGGVKQSGVGREGSHEGCEEYLDTKYVCLGL